MDVLMFPEVKHSEPSQSSSTNERDLDEFRVRIFPAFYKCNNHRYLGLPL